MANMKPALSASTVQSYTTPRPDIAAAVPSKAVKILDVGCSNGALGASLRVARPDRIVCGLECDREFCNEARAKLNNVVQVDLETYKWDGDFPDGYFDCMIFADVLEHLRSPWDILRKSLHLLAPHGTVVISLPNIRHISAIHSLFIRGTFPRTSRGIFDRTHLRWFTISDGVQLCTEAGLSIVQVSGTLRLFDAPGGKVNRYVERFLGRAGAFKPIRELLVYQFVLTAERTIR